jgi:hypothetical protein
MFEVGKEYPLRNGSVMRVDDIRTGEPYPIYGKHKSEHRTWREQEWAADGSFYGPGQTSGLDIIAPAASTPSDLDTLKASHAELLRVLKAAQEELRLIRMKDSDAVYDTMLRTDMSAAITNAEKL